MKLDLRSPLLIELGSTPKKDRNPRVPHFDGGCKRLITATHEALKTCPWTGSTESSPLGSSGAFARDYLQTSCFSKWNGGDRAGSDSRKAKAAERAAEAERMCYQANGLLVDFETRGRLSNRSREVLLKAQSILDRILGRPDMDEIVKRVGFGPGASTSLSRREASQQNKWDQGTHITESALPYYDAFRRFASGVQLPDTEVVHHNAVVLVPKNSETDRTIAIEPDWNMFFQKGVGGAIRARLRRIGLLLPDAQARHSRLAWEGSLTGKLATLDLSMASDTVSLGLTEALVHPRWCRLLFDLRSKTGLFRDDARSQPWQNLAISYQKVSSMGNGYTFELETALFYSIVLAATGERIGSSRVSVYGDDIVCPSHRAEDVLDVLHEIGFAMNPSKSFFKGEFRESCGGHFWRGVNVTPFYVKKPLTTAISVIQLHNQVLAWHAQLGIPRLNEAWRHVVHGIRAIVPREFWGPWGCSENAIWSSFSEARPTWRSRYQTDAYWTVTKKDIQVSAQWNGSYVYKLWMEDMPELESSWVTYPGSIERASLVNRGYPGWDAPKVLLT